MPSYHPNTSDDAEEVYTGKHVELIVPQRACTETAHCITKQENYLLHNDIYSGPDSSLCHKANQKNNQDNLYVKLVPHTHTHTHHCNKQTTTQNDSPVYVVTPIYGQS